MLDKLLPGFLLLFATTGGPAVVLGDELATRQETVVRTTYAKLRFALKIAAIHDLLIENHQPAAGELEYRVAAKEIKFELSDFSAGAVAEIAKRPYSELVTKPEGQDVIDVGTITYNSKEDLEDQLEVRETTELGARASWVTGQNLIDEKDWNKPFAWVLSVVIEPQNKSRYSRYVSYHVNVLFEGKSRTYNAMLLFGSGENPTLILDNVTNNSALAFLMNRSLYPQVLLESKLAEKPAIANWLKTHQLQDSACASGHKQVCCDLRTLTCGVSETDVNAALRRPVSRDVQPLRSFPDTIQKKTKPTFVTVSASFSRAAGSADCSDYNFSRNGTVANDTDTTEHQPGGYHGWHSAPFGNCTYSDTGGSSCIADLSVSTPPVTVSETGGVTGDCHNTAHNEIGGSASGASPTATTNSGAVAVACHLCTCAPTPTVGFSGTNPVFPTPNLWSKANPYTLTCPARTTSSPIVVDVTGHGFHLTSQSNGVPFDIEGNGHKVQIAWTDPSYGNAFLALDRDGNGKIDGGKELFGNFTDQPKSDDPNGFLALAVFDDPANGGNGDGIIDERDRVWSRLRLWIDENHDGISQPEELHALSDVGVYSVALRYEHIRHYDQFGNLFRYKGKLNPTGQPQDDYVDRVIYDVFLNTNPR